MPDESSEIILPSQADTRSHRHSRTHQGLIVTDPSLPADLIPSGHTHQRTESGLSIVTQSSTPELQVFTEADVPQHQTATEKAKSDDQLVPLYLWMDNPAAALHNLASQKNNEEALYLIKEAQKYGTVIALANLNDEIIHQDEKNAAHEALDKFFVDALNDSKVLLAGRETQKAILSNLSGLSDLLRSQTTTLTLPGYKTVEAVTRLVTEEDIPITPSMLEFLGRFDIPPSLAGQLLPHINKAHLISDPFALTLLDKLPPDHPFKQNERHLYDLTAQTTNNPALLLIGRLRTESQTAKEDLQSEVHSPATKEKLHAALDTFFADALQNSKQSLINEKNYLPIFNLSRIADLLRFQTQTIILSGEKTVQMISQLTSEGAPLTPILLDFLTRFDIPAPVAGELLTKMDKARLLTHPLAWHLLDKLPDDHQFKQDQRDRVQILKTLLSGKITPEKQATARKVGMGIISVYIDPDNDENKDKVGLELETVPAHVITVPEGTTMGRDNGNYLTNDSVPELRLNNEDEVLTYGKDWRQRYYNIHLWSEITQAQDKSLHIHVNRNLETQPFLYNMLFGFDTASVLQNHLGTMEIKGTALAGYNDAIEAGARGFASEFMPDLVELAYSLRNCKLTPIALEALKSDRFTFFTQLVEDPTARAAMLLASRGEAGLRVVNPNGLYAKAKDMKPGTRHEYLRLNMFDEASRTEIVRNVLRTGSEEDRSDLAKAIGDMDHDLQELVINEGLAIRKNSTIQQASYHIQALSPEMQQRIYNLVRQESPKYFENIAHNVASLTPKLQQDLLQDLVSLNDPTTTPIIGGHLDRLDPTVRATYLKLAFDDKYGPALNGLTFALPYLTDSQQQRLFEMASEKDMAWLRNALTRRIVNLIPELQVRILDDALNSNSLYLVDIAASITKLAPEARDKFLTWISRAQDSNGLYGLLNSQSFPKLSPVDQERVVSTALSVLSADPDHSIILFGLVSFLKEMPPNLRQKVIDVAISDGRQFIKLAENIEILPPDSQRAAIEMMIHQIDRDALAEVARNITKLAPDLQKKVVKYVFENDVENAIKEVYLHIGQLSEKDQEYILKSAGNGLMRRSIESNLKHWKYSLTA